MCLYGASSQESPDDFWCYFIGIEYSWSLTSVVVFRRDPLWCWFGADHTRSQMCPSFVEFRNASVTNWLHSNDLKACMKSVTCIAWFHSEVKVLNLSWCCLKSILSRTLLGQYHEYGLLDIIIVQVSNTLSTCKSIFNSAKIQICQC